MARKKRAWNMSNPLYRYLQSKKSKSRRSTSRSNTMAKRKRYSRRASGASTGGLLMTVGASMLYGVARSKLSAVTSQYLPQFAGTYTDELVLGGLGWYLSKKGGLIGAVGKSALIIESARVGDSLGSSMFGGSVTTSATSYNNLLG